MRTQEEKDRKSEKKMGPKETATKRYTKQTNVNVFKTCTKRRRERQERLYLCTQ